MSVLKEGLADRYSAVVAALAKAEADAGRPAGSVRLLAVSKTFPAEALEQACALGVRAFGENYAQEGCAKVDWFAEHHPELRIEWHFIGPLQSNKTRPVAERFDWVQSVDRIRIAQRLSDQRPADREPINILLEVNIDGEATKSGFALSEVEDAARAVQAMPGVKLRGLMAIPEPQSDPAQQALPLSRMRALFDELNAKGFALDTLSMGMSADMAAAVAEGATMVRIGSAIFGARDYGTKQ